MQIDDLGLGGVALITPKRFGDSRGFFSETFKLADLEEALGPLPAFVQDNHSLSTERGVVRGLHFQAPPHAQDKLVRVTRGAVLDVAVDIRTGSPTFGQHVAVELSAENWQQLWVPKGFAHGFCTLEPNTEVIYKVTAYYAPESDAGILWNDPALGIDWPIGPSEAALSQKDQNQPLLADLPAVFEYGAS